MSRPTLPLARYCWMRLTLSMPMYGETQPRCQETTSTISRYFDVPWIGRWGGRASSVAPWPQRAPGGWPGWLECPVMGTTEAAPYPQELERDVTLKDGTRVRLRPLRPDDAPRLQALYDHLSR